jgi:phosphodiesterase/alkaline phosphatase D-like protein
MVNGLLPNTTYHYRLKADGGGSLVVYGENQTFTTPAA